MRAEIKIRGCYFVQKYKKEEKELVGNQTAQIHGAGGPVGRRSFFKNGKANSKSETHGRVIRIESGDIQEQSGARSGEFPVAFFRLFIFDKNLSMVDESIKRQDLVEALHFWVIGQWNFEREGHHILGRNRKPVVSPASARG